MPDAWRGHEIHLAGGHTWVYLDTGEAVRENPDRPCGHCGLASTPEGHDGCLGTLPGVRNACCGHGVVEEAYVQLDDGTRLEGREALDAFQGYVACCFRLSMSANPNF